MTSLISVVIPSFNRQNTLERSIRSVLNQSWENLECIVVDDASDDDSTKIVKQLMENDSRLKLIELTENGGPARARNIGSQAAKGEWLAFQDSDDEWLPNKLSLQIETAKQDKNCGLVFCKMRRIKQGGKGAETAPQSLPSGPVSIETLLVQSIAWTITLMVKRNAFEQVGGFDPRLKRLEDWDLSLKIAAQNTVLYSNEVLSIAHESEGSLLSNYRHYSDYFRILLDNHAATLKQYPHIKQKHQTRLALHALYWHGEKPTASLLGQLGWPNSKTLLLLVLCLFPRTMRTRLIQAKTGWGTP